MASGLEDVVTQHGFAQILVIGQRLAYRLASRRWVLDYEVCAFRNLSHSENHKMTDYQSFWFVAQREAGQQ
jgi:hypothetical protein